MYVVECTDAIAVLDFSHHRQQAGRSRRKRNAVATGFSVYEGSQLAPMVRRVQRIDRRSDWYSETVTCAVTGRVIYEKREPLSEHKDRGDARRRAL